MASSRMRSRAGNKLFLGESLRADAVNENVSTCDNRKDESTIYPQDLERPGPVEWYGEPMEKRWYMALDLKYP